ncbi:T-cell surface glycoprotein CD8 alpha chain-like isoform X1 [Centroberyx gerrardi]
MDQKRIQTLVILLLYQNIASGASTGALVTKEQTPVEIKCVPSSRGSLVIWFRVVDNKAMEYIASFSNGFIKQQSSSYKSIFAEEKISQDILLLKSFNKIRDSGIYSCASLTQNKLFFGEVTRLVGQETKVATEAPPAANTKLIPSTSTKACVCTSQNKQGERNPSMLCNPIILGPLAGSCGLLLLLLIVTICYCNHRARRLQENKRWLTDMSDLTGTHSVTFYLIPLSFQVESWC